MGFTAAAIFIFVCGLCVGSFLNVVIYRLPNGLPVHKGFSMCPDCEHRLLAPDLVPLLSWIFLRGRCRYCGGRISPRYLVVELLTGLLWLAVWLRQAGSDPELWALGAPPAAFMTVGAHCLIVSALVAVIFIDARHMIIPNALVLVVAAAGILLCFTPAPPDLLERVIGFFAVSGPLLLLAVFSGGRAMGMGDIKLMAAAGLCLGWPAAVTAFMIGALLGSAVSVAAAARAGRKLGGRIPFGPYLAGGIIICLFYGRELVALYLSLF
ncbi:MAG: prepilin peptidase [Gracilibacteraceae bacterium]|jgi:leader peptidase (prepilin peptidase)/N-methyltransferase|nr:prepilin peptidase [Gracilibacteraceae bacterium]